VRRSVCILLQLPNFEVTRPCSVDNLSPVNATDWVEEMNVTGVNKVFARKEYSIHEYYSFTINYSSELYVFPYFTVNNFAFYNSK
jgi:hypothetical protein